MPKKPQILSTQSLAKTKLFEVESVHLQFANGQLRHFERLKRSNSKKSAVMIAPLLDNDTVLLVREYGAGMEDYYLGLPKGIVEVDEDVLVAANRELMEEVGYGAKSLKLIKRLSLSPGYMLRAVGLVLAQDLYEKKLIGDEPEPLEVVPWRLSQLEQLLAREDFHEATSIAALFMIRELLRGE